MPLIPAASESPQPNPTAPALPGILESLGWKPVDCSNEQFGPAGTLGRDNRGEVILRERLRTALRKLNPDTPDEALESAIGGLAIDRSESPLFDANREVYGLLKDANAAVKLIDWDQPANNDFLLAVNMRVTGASDTRETAAIGFVNGIPLLFIQPVPGAGRLEDAYAGFADARAKIPHLFWYNGFVILANALEARLGSITARFELFTAWKHSVEPIQTTTPRSPFPDVVPTPSSVTASGMPAPAATRIGPATRRGGGKIEASLLETTIRAACEPGKLLDIVENFTLFSESAKIIARNHQHLGVNKVHEGIQRQVAGHRRPGPGGRLGIFWHTPGSGKSLSIAFLTQKIVRKAPNPQFPPADPGSWTFLIVTDRSETARQIEQTFAACGLAGTRAEGIEQLPQLLGERRQYIFAPGPLFDLPTAAPSLPGAPGPTQHLTPDTPNPFPKLSERADIIVIADEAHEPRHDARSDSLKSALPNAAFIAFTGAPLIVGEEKSRRVFGDYASVYNFRQALGDRVAVPLYYEVRKPNRQLPSIELSEELIQAIENAEIRDGGPGPGSRNPEAESEDAAAAAEVLQAMEQYGTITADDRLEDIAQDIVTHFLARGEAGKAFVVAIDDGTAARMHEKVLRHWQVRLDDMRRRMATADGSERADVDRTIGFMTRTGMIRVGPQTPETEAERFKDPDDPLRIAFVSSRWMTGLDVPCCTTVYLDRPMRNRNLMLTIARASRVFGGKAAGMVVDYVGALQDLPTTLASYGSGARSGVMAGDWPIARKETLIQLLRSRVQEVDDLARDLGLELGAMRRATGFEVEALTDSTTEGILSRGGIRDRYLTLSDEVDRLYNAILPDPAAQEFRLWRRMYAMIADRLRADRFDFEVSAQTGQGLSARLSLELDELQKDFLAGRKRASIAKLWNGILSVLREMTRRNPSRGDWLRRLQPAFEDYRTGTATVERFFNDLLEFARELRAEEQRGVGFGLNEEELAIYDQLRSLLSGTSEPDLTAAKSAARALIETLKRDKLIPNWRRTTETRTVVRQVIQDQLDRLPETFDRDRLPGVADAIYQHVYDSYFGAGKSVYGEL